MPSTRLPLLRATPRPLVSAAVAASGASISVSSRRSAGRCEWMRSDHSMSDTSCANAAGSSSDAHSSMERMRYRSRWWILCKRWQRDACNVRNHAGAMLMALWSRSPHRNAESGMAYVCFSANVGEGTSSVGCSIRVRINCRMNSLFPTPTGLKHDRRDWHRMEWRNA